MLFSSLKRNRNAASARSRAEPRRRASARLFLEPLEERLAPATRVWDGGSTLNSNWSTAANWVGDVAPVPGVDDLQFPATAARKTSTNDFIGAAFLGIAFTGSNYVLGGNPLTLGGNLTTGQGAISDYLNLSLTLSGDRTIQLGASSALTVNGVLAGPGGFTKAGTGLLVLCGANSYAGLTQVSEGSLYVEHPSALGSTTGGTVIAKGAAIRLINIPGPVVFPPEPLTFGTGTAASGAALVNSVSDATWTGPVTLDPGENNFVSESGKTLRFSGAIGGAGGFRQISSGGILEFAGTAPNTYAGATQFSRGTFRLNKAAGVTAIPGALAIGTNDASAGVVTLLAADQIADAAAVTLAGGGGFFGTLNLNGFAETIGSLAGYGGHVLLGGGTLTTGVDNSTTLFGGDITGAGGLTKVGSGTFTLTGASTYTGPTVVSAGNLRVNGSLTSAVTVNGSGTLSGTGTTGGVTAAAGVIVNPGGTGPGILTAAGGVALGPGSSFVVRLNGTAPGSGYDQLRVTGAGSTVSLGGSLSVQVGFAPAGQSFTIIDNGGSGPVAGTFGGLPEGALVQVGARTFRISYRGGDGNDVVLTHLPAAPQAGIEWRSQFGGLSPFSDGAGSVATDGSGNVYVAGSTDGSLPGQFRAGSGGYDAYVRKYDFAGDVLWTREFGSGADDFATGVAVDASGVYLVGFTFGTLPGKTGNNQNGTVRDAFVRKYDFAGNEQWTQQFGAAADDIAYGVAVDPSGVYVAGVTYGTLPGQTSAGDSDAFVCKFDAASGNLQWTSQFGSSLPDFASGITANASGVYVAGTISGTILGQVKAFVRKVDAATGQEVWTQKLDFGLTSDAFGVAVDASGVYMVGQIQQVGAHDEDAFVRKYDLGGKPLWTSLFATATEDGAGSVAVDASGVYVVGDTNIDVNNPGPSEAFVRKYDAAVGKPLWTSLIADGDLDGAGGVAVDASGVYVAGETGSTLLGQVSAGDEDAFVRKYDTAAGSELWTRQFGASEPDAANGVSADASGVYVAGETHGYFPGWKSAGGFDAFVRRYDAAGDVLWTQQFGTSGTDQAIGVAVGASGVYVVGATSGSFPGYASAGNFDVFVRKYDANGNPQWTQQFGSTDFDIAYGVAVDASGVYVVGQTFGTLPGQTSFGGADAFVSKFDLDGKPLWTHQFGTGGDDDAGGVTVGASGVYVAGVVGGTLPGQVSSGGTDAFVRKYDANGNELWTRQFGTGAFDGAGGMTVDASGVYVDGVTSGTLPGQASAGDVDAFVRKYDASGNEVWTRQFGTSDNDGAAGIAANASGVHVAENIGAVAQGGFAFVRKFDDAGNELWNFALDPGSGDEAHGVTAGASGVYVAGQTLGLFPAYDAFVAKIREATQPAVVRPDARVAGPTAGAARTPGQPARRSGGRPAGVRPALDLRIGAPRRGGCRRAAYGQRGPRVPRRGVARAGGGTGRCRAAAAGGRPCSRRGRGLPPGRGAPERPPGRGAPGLARRTAGHGRSRGQAWLRPRHGGPPPPPRPAARLNRAAAGPGVGLVRGLATLRRNRARAFDHGCRRPGGKVARVPGLVPAGRGVDLYMLKH